MQETRPKRVALYLRLSIATEESVSIERQRRTGHQYAAARGWVVVAEFVDDGVSATKTRLDERKGWRALLASTEKFEGVLVWKIDRLARRTMDFLNADQALKARGAGIVSVEESIDMTTSQGRGFATILAVFAEMEADAIGARVKASRAHLRSEGRVVGGRLPYGYRSEKRGPGRYLVQDPERIPHLKKAAEMILAGGTVRSVVAYLDEISAPLPPSKNRKRDGWHWSSVDKMLRNPVLWGATLDNPGNGSKARGPDVRRGADGLPVVNPGTAILTAAEHRRLVRLLDDRERPRSTQTATSPFFSRLVTCGHCDRLMHRTRKNNRESLVCPECAQTIATRQLRAMLTERLLAERGATFLWEHTDATPKSADLAEVDHAIKLTTQQLAEDDADVPVLVARLTALKASKAKSLSDGPIRQFRILRSTVSEAWEAARNDEECRAVLSGQLASLRVVRGRVGRLLDPARVEIVWLPEVPDGVVLPGGQRLVHVSDDAVTTGRFGGAVFSWGGRESIYFEAGN